MKRRLFKNLVILACIATLMFTGCGKNNSDADNTADTVVDATNVSEDDIAATDSDEKNEDAVVTSGKDEKDAANAKEPTEDDKDSVTGKGSDDDTDSDAIDGDSGSDDTDEDSDADDIIGLGGSGTTSGSSSGSSTGSGSGSSTGSGSGSGAGTSTHKHIYDAGKVTRSATCSVIGIKTYTCSCGDSYSVEIPKTAHTYYLGYCSVCNAADPSYVETYTYEVVLETGMLGLINGRRSSLGYGSLVWDSTMDEVAKIRARELADDFRHTYAYPYSETITCSGRYMTASDCHTNYVNSVGHDTALHKDTYTKMSSATCYKKDSRGNIVATYNIVLLDVDGGGDGGIIVPPGTVVDPNPPSPGDIIW